jgi:asparagine N-glycosylation enzyme membrane subunit Stt3
MSANNPRKTAIIYAVLASVSLGVFLVASIITAAADDGVNIGATLFVLVGIVFAALAGHYWTMPPRAPGDHPQR